MVDEFFNPFKWFGKETYISFWKTLLSTVFLGFWAKFFAVVFFIAALWVGVRRQRYRQAVLFYLFAFLLAYGGGLYKFFLKVLSAFKVM